MDHKIVMDPNLHRHHWSISLGERATDQYTSESESESESKTDIRPEIEPKKLHFPKKISTFQSHRLYR